MSDLNGVQEQLAKPFDETEIKWKPQVTTKGKTKEPIMRGNQQVAGCTAHIDARAVMSRLDDVVGVGGWSDSYKVLDSKHVECTLTVLGVSKSDVGETNEGGFADPIKSAYSDALKRAAVKFGIGRHLYEMEMEWLPFDGYRIIENHPTQKSGQQKSQSPEPGTWPHVEAGGATNGKKPTVTSDQQKPTAAMMRALGEGGRALYGSEWGDKLKELVSNVTAGRSDDLNHLTRAECQKLIDGITAKADAVR